MEKFLKHTTCLNLLCLLRRETTFPVRTSDRSYYFHYKGSFSFLSVRMTGNSWIRGFEFQGEVENTHRRPGEGSVRHPNLNSLGRVFTTERPLTITTIIIKGSKDWVFRVHNIVVSTLTTSETFIPLWVGEVSRVILVCPTEKMILHSRNFRF